MDLGMTAALRAQKREATVQLPSGPSPYVIGKLRRPLCGTTATLSLDAVSLGG